MRVLLINPYTTTSVYGKMTKDMPVRAIPLGLLYIAAVLQKEGKEVKLIDADTECIDLTVLSGLIKDYSPDIVGITCSTPGFRHALQTAELVKSLSKALVVIGGPHVSALADEILREYKVFDIVVRGEGEFSMLELCNGLPRDRILGISHKIGTQIIHNAPRPRNKNLDDLPMPAYDRIDLSLYTHPLYKMYIDRIAPVISGRGCCFECTFCASKVIYGMEVIYHSIDRVMDEVKYLINEKGVTGINFLDDTFTLHKGRLSELCRRLKELKIRWVCNVRADTATLEMLKTMQDSGCCLIQVGVESLDQRVLDLMKKRVSIEQLVTLFKWTNAIGLDTSATFIIGMPGDSEETIKRTIMLARRINSTYSQFFSPVPYPGTEIYEYAKNNNLLLFNDWTEIYAAKYERPAMKHAFLDAGYLKSSRKKAAREVYLNPRYAVSHFFPALTDSRKRKVIQSGIMKFIKDFII